MARPLRVIFPEAWYHVIGRGIERRAIFRSDAYYQKFESLLAALPERFGVRLHTCMLMPSYHQLQIETLQELEELKWTCYRACAGDPGGELAALIAQQDGGHEFTMRPAGSNLKI